VANALGVVHSKSMYHMDIKPGNIMLDSQGEVKLIDFGASKQIVAGKNSAISVSTSGFCYTPGYAPGEQVNQLGKNVGPWTDFYALGGTLYNLLTLLPPPSVFDIFEDAEDAFNFPDNVSQHTRQLICWMMRPQIAKRPQSATELLAAIHGGEVPERDHKKNVEPKKPRFEPLADVNDTIIENNDKENISAKVVSNPEPQKKDSAQKSKKPMVIVITAIALLIFIVFGVYGFMSKSDGTSAVPNSITAETDSVAADSVAKAEALAKEDSIKQVQEAARQAEESAKKQAELRARQETAKRNAKQAAAQRQQRHRQTRQTSQSARQTPATPTPQPSKPRISITFKE